MVNCKNGFGGCDERKAENHSAHRVVVAAVACTPLTARLWQRLKEATGPEGWLCESRFWCGACAVWEAIHPVVLLLISAMALAGNSYNPFLYFQF